MATIAAINMIAIYKSPLEITPVQTIEVKGAQVLKILSAQSQEGVLYLWLLVKDDPKPTASKNIKIAIIGDKDPADQTEGLTYIGTFKDWEQDRAAVLVYHVFAG